MLKIIFKVIVLMVFSGTVFAQQGPNIVCYDCDGLEARTMPVSGSWYNPQQSGSGYQFDIQNGIFLGYYYGYDASGEPIWRLFTGPLVESEEPGIMWEITANLDKFTGGNAFNQPFQAPTAESTNDQITLKFPFKHYAHVSINEGEVQNIVPINFGVRTTKDFPESDQLFPELEGVWSYVLTINNDQQLFAYFGHEFYISEKIIPPDDNGTKRISYSFLHSTFPPESVNFSNLDCINPVNIMTGMREVTCYINNQPLVGDRMVVAPGDIGHNYIFGQNENGDTFEAFRYNYLPNYGIPVEPEDK